MNVMTPVLADSHARLTAMTAHGRSLLVEAGAGSGKTAVMAGRLALLLAGGVEPKRIAAVTFTELAASELLARVRDFVDELLDGHVPRELELALPDGLSAEQRAHLEHACASLDEITCSTIHGFCQRLIKPYPVEADIDPGAALIDPAQADLAFDDAVDRWLRDLLDGDAPSLVSELVFQSPAQAVELVREVAYALRRHRMLSAPATSPIPPLVRTFREAATAFHEFVTEAVAQEAESIELGEAFVGMADGVAVGASREDPGTLVGLLTATAHPSLCKKDGSFSQYRYKGKWETAAKAAGLSKNDGAALNTRATELHSTACEAWTELLQAVAGRVLAELIEAAGPVVRTFRDYKRSAALLDFDDLIFAARDLLRDHEPVRRALGDRYRHLLVDEFQDTDPLQSEIFWRLCGDPADGADGADWAAYVIRPGSLFLVGDPKQAIYRFRGADVAAYVRARDAIRAGDGRNLLTISTNFRSCAGILSFVNERFEPHMGEDKGQPGFTALDPFHPDPASGLCVVALDIACAGEDGSASAERQRDCEAEAVADLCARLIGSHIITDRKAGGERPCRPGDIALLAPTGTDLWRYEEALERRGIPVATQAGKGFFRRQEVQDLIALTRVLADGRDTLALGALLRGPLVGLTEEELLDLVWAQPRDPERPDALPRLRISADLDAVAHPIAKDMLAKLQQLRRRINATTPHQLLAEAVDMLRVRPVLLGRHGGQAERPLANVDLYLSLARPYGVRGLRAFSDAMTAAWQGKTRAAEGRPDAQEEAVSLFTVHASKGLEWPVVVPINTMTTIMNAGSTVVDRDAGLLFMPVMGVKPSGYAEALEAEKAELDRERARLWYVAATRARELLVLPRPDVSGPSNSWSRLVDLELGALEPIDVSHHDDLFELGGDNVVNGQTRDVFASEAAAIVAAGSRLRWMAPSRDEGPAASAEVAAEPAIQLSDAEDVSGAAPVIVVQGGRERGLVIHKLFEEVLTSECVDDQASLAARATELIEQLGLATVSDPAQGISADEVAAVVVRTLALPEVAVVRARLVPELPVYGTEQVDDVEVGVTGAVDAFAIGPDGRPELVIDWKSDVDPDPATAEHYRGQVKRYLDVTGTPKGMVVFVTTGRIMDVLG